MDVLFASSSSSYFRAYVSYFKWWVGLNCAAGYVALAIALAACDSNPVCHSNPNTTIGVLISSLPICFFAHIDQINTRTFRVLRLLGYLTCLSGLCLLFIVVTYILSTSVPSAPALA